MAAEYRARQKAIQYDCHSRGAVFRLKALRRQMAQSFLPGGSHDDYRRNGYMRAKALQALRFITYLLTLFSGRRPPAWPGVRYIACTPATVLPQRGPPCRGLSRRHPSRSMSWLFFFAAALFLTLSVACKKTPTQPANRPPVIQQASPADSLVNLVPGQSQSFSVRAADADGDSLRYRWTLKQQVVSTDTQYTFRADERGKYVLQVEVSDGRDGRAGRDWLLYVGENTPPVVELSLQGGAQVGYSDSTVLLAQAYDLYHYPDSLVSLQLSVDDSVVARAESPDTARIRFVFIGSDWPVGEHHVRAVASDGKAISQERKTLTRLSVSAPKIEIWPDTSTVLNPNNTGYELRYTVTPGDSTVPVSTGAMLRDIQKGTADTIATGLPLEGRLDLTPKLKQLPEGTYLPEITVTDPDQTTTQPGKPISIDTTPPTIDLSITSPVKIDTTLTAHLQDKHLAKESIQVEIKRKTDGKTYKPPIEYDEEKGTLKIRLPNLMYNQEHELTITATDKAGNTTKQHYTFKAESVFYNKEITPRMKENSKKTIDVNKEIKNPNLENLVLQIRSSNPDKLQGTINGLNVTIDATVNGGDYNTTEYPQELLDLEALQMLDNGVYKSIGNLKIVPEVEIMPDLTAQLENLFTPDIDSTFQRVPIPPAHILVAKANNLKELYKGIPEETLVTPFWSPIPAQKIIDTLRTTNGKARIQLEKGKKYAIIIRTGNSIDARVAPFFEAIRFFRAPPDGKDITATYALADTTNLPPKHTSIALYGFSERSYKDGNLVAVLHGQNLTRPAQPFHTIYISTLPAEGSGNPVPQEWINEIKKIYEEFKQMRIFHTKYFPDGFWTPTNIIIGDQPPPEGTEGVVLWKADDTITGEASTAHYRRGRNNSEIYSQRVTYRTDLRPERIRPVVLHEAATIFVRYNTPLTDRIRSVFDWGTKYEELQPADMALLYYLLSNPPGHRWFDRAYQ